MPETQTIDVLVLVKAAPVMTQDLDETMCVAGVRVDGDLRQWIRLHPVPFRDLADDSKFTKYQVVTVNAIHHRTDRRPETLTPLHGTVRPGASIAPDHGWAARRPFIDALGELTMCELVGRNRAGSGPGIPSLGVVRPVEPPKLVITQRDAVQISKWQSRATAAAARPSLFDDPEKPKPAFEVIPWRFSYRYRCAAADCQGHDQTIVDWEAATLWRHVRHRADWRDAMVEKFERQMWKGRDSVLFVGNMEQYPVSFLVLGVFWPPNGAVQGVLDL
jgi:hypothetical protein